LTAVRETSETIARGSGDEATIRSFSGGADHGRDSCQRRARLRAHVFTDAEMVAIWNAANQLDAGEATHTKLLPLLAPSPLKAS
jgi:hypothetical protein